MNEKYLSLLAKNFFMRSEFFFSYGINVSLLQIYQKRNKTSFLISLSDAFLQQLRRAHSKCLHFFLLAKRKDGHMLEQSHI